MLGDAEEWFYRGLGGIDVDFSRIGANRILLHPVVLPQLTWVRTSYRSALGRVESNWRRGESATEYEFTIPIDTVATIEISTASPNTVTVNGRAATKAQTAANTVQFILPSGHYRVYAANPVTTR